MLRVVRFNWPKLLGGIIFAVIATVVSIEVRGIYGVLLVLSALGAVYFVVASVLSTWYVYDRGRVENLDWVFQDDTDVGTQTIASIHVGYDDVRSGLERHSSTVTGLYHSTKHEFAWHGHSLARAIEFDDRTGELPLLEAVESGREFDLVVFGFSAHELRDTDERRVVLDLATRIVKPTGSIMLLEHARDLQNFVCYGPGAFHFLREATWLADFQAVNLRLLDEYRFRGLVRSFVLQVQT